MEQELSSHVLGLHFLLSGSTPGVWSLLLALGLLGPGPAKSSWQLSGVCRSFWLEADTASFHGHKHFSMLLQLQAFGVYGPALMN